MRWLTTRNNQNLSLNTIQNELDSFFNSFFDYKPVSLSETSWAPKIDVTEKEQEYQIKAEIPGLNEKDINVSIENRLLTIKGEKNKEANKEDKENKYILSERMFGSFQRSITLPENIKTDNIKASFKNGVLSIKIEKEKIEEPKKIEINVH